MPGQAWTMIPPISASQVVRIILVSHVPNLREGFEPCEFLLKLYEVLKLLLLKGT
jgi:hypothetical protein